MIANVMKNKDTVLVKHKSKLSYVGTIADMLERENGHLFIVLKPSEKSELLIYLPSEEVERVYLKDGKIIEGKELYENV